MNRWRKKCKVVIKLTCGWWNDSEKTSVSYGWYSEKTNQAKSFKNSLVEPKMIEEMVQEKSKEKRITKYLIKLTWRS